jgi:ferredoxin-thioredoxin reductase catalytic subunit
MDQQRIEKVIKRWKDFADRQRGPGEFKINNDLERVKLLAEGVLNNEDNHGFKYCPCRLISKDPVADAKLICPCNFKDQKTWKEKGECWCSLFVKRSK